MAADLRAAAVVVEEAAAGKAARRINASDKHSEYAKINAVNKG